MHAALLSVPFGSSFHQSLINGILSAEFKQWNGSRSGSSVGGPVDNHFTRRQGSLAKQQNSLPVPLNRHCWLRPSTKWSKASQFRPRSSCRLNHTSWNHRSLSHSTDPIVWFSYETSCTSSDWGWADYMRWQKADSLGSTLATTHWTPLLHHSCCRCFRWPFVA